MLAEANECQKKNEESDCEQANNSALIAGALSRLQLELPLLQAQRIRAILPIAHNPILRAAADSERSRSALSSVLPDPPCNALYSDAAFPMGTRLAAQS